MELIVVISILSLVFYFSSSMITDGFKNTRFESEQATMVETARKSMDVITKDIRGANTSEKGDYPIVTAQDDELTFFNDINGDDKMEKIKYYLTGPNLIREIYLPGDLKDYAIVDYSNTIAAHINNGDLSIFSYYDSNSEETDVINQVRMIKIHLVINITPATAPNDYILESNVNLRNLKDF